MSELEKMRRKAAKLKNPTPIELPSGKWRCQVTVGGVRESIIDHDPEVAHVKALAIRSSLLQKENKKKSLALSQAIEQYVAEKENVLSPSTIRGYETVRKNRFPWLMQRNIYSINKQEVQRAINEEAKRVSPKTVYNSYGVIRPVLKYFDVDVSGLKLPQKIKPIKQYLEAHDIATLIDAARGDSCEIPILMAIWLGMRRSEIMGICWDCVDFSKNLIHIRRTMVPDKDHHWVLKEGAKNERSQRTIRCPEYIMQMLHQIHNDEENGLIFKMSPDTVRKHLHTVCASAGITDTTIHGLRHTNAAVMRKLEIADAYAMARGGWSSEQTFKQIYSYIFSDDASKADDTINSFFESLITKTAHEIAHDKK